MSFLFENGDEIVGLVTSGGVEDDDIVAETAVASMAFAPTEEDAEEDGDAC